MITGKFILSFYLCLFTPLSVLAELPSYVTGKNPPISGTINYPAGATGGDENTAIIQDILRTTSKKAAQAKQEKSIPQPTPVISNYLNPTVGAAMPTYPIIATAPKTTNHKPSKDQCFAKINQKLKEITTNELSVKPQKAVGLIDLLNNQTEKSFLKFSRAFIRAGYYRYAKGEEPGSVMASLEKDLKEVMSGNDANKSDAKIIEDFFNAVAKNKETSTSFSQFSAALRRYSRSDDPTFHINDADLLVMKSIINYTRNSNKRKMSLKDRLLDQMRQVFPKRNFEKDDLEQIKSYHQRYQAESDSESYTAAKKAFAEKARAVILDYSRGLEKECFHYYFDDKGKLKLDALPENCNTSNYLQSLFSDAPLAKMEPLLEYLNQNDIAWDSDQFLRVAGVKATPKYCQISEKNKLTVSLDIENLPMKFTQHWYLSCEGCDKGDAPLTNPKLEQKFEETRTIEFSGNAPKELFITNPEVPHKVKVSLENCKYLPTAEEEVATTPVSAPAPAPAVESEQVKAEPEVVAEAQKESAECEDPTHEKVKDKCVPKCKDDEERDDESGKCLSNDPDALLADQDKKSKKDGDEASLEKQKRSRSSAKLPQPQYVPIPQNSFYIKAGFN